MEILVSEIELKQGDKIINASDGIENIGYKKMIEILNDSQEPNQAQNLVEEGRKTKNDDCTVQVINFSIKNNSQEDKEKNSALTSEPLPKSDNSTTIDLDATKSSITETKTNNDDMLSNLNISEKTFNTTIEVLTTKMERSPLESGLTVDEAENTLKVVKEANNDNNLKLKLTKEKVATSELPEYQAKLEDFLLIERDIKNYARDNMYIDVNEDAWKTAVGLEFQDEDYKEKLSAYFKTFNNLLNGLSSDSFTNWIYNTINTLDGSEYN